MNYREKQKQDPAEKKMRKLSSYRKKYQDPLMEKLDPILQWEETADEKIEKIKESTPMMPEPGDELFMTGWVGSGATIFLADWKREKLCSRFPVAFINTVRDRDVFGSGGDVLDAGDGGRYRFLCDPSAFSEKCASWIAPVGEGGLMKALYRLGKESGLGFRVQSRMVPVRQITIEFSEFFLLHPWEMLTGDSFLFTAKHDSELLISLEEAGIPFSRIGVITKEKQKLICHGDEKSNINRPEPDGVLTLLLEGQKA